MRIHVIAQTEARQELLELLIERAPTTRGDDAARLADVYLMDVEENLIRYEGIPPSAMHVRGTDGNDYWWQYTKGVWVVYSFEDRQGVIFRGVVRTVTINAFRKDLPR